MNVDHDDFPRDDEILPSWQRRISVDEYHKMIEAGILGSDDRVELIDGFLVAMSPHGLDHTHAMVFLNRLFARALSERYQVRPQVSVTLGQWGEPEPDLAVVDVEEIPKNSHPTWANLIIEVADSSLRKDRRVKARLYASFGIPDYWIINVRDRCVEVHREPDPTNGRYLRRFTAKPGDTLAPADLPGPEVPVAALFRDDDE